MEQLEQAIREGKEGGLLRVDKIMDTKMSKKAKKKLESIIKDMTDG